MELIEIIAGLVTIGGGLYGLLRWIQTRGNKTGPSGLFLKNGNIHLIFRTGSTVQVTFSNADIKPVLGRRKVIFFREKKSRNRDREFSHYKLISLDLKTLKEEIITDQKPFADGLDNSYKILGPGTLTFSDNESSVIFTVEKYATASQLVKVNVLTGQWIELFSVEKVEVIASGEHKGKLLVGRSEIRDKGRDIYYSICNLDGSTLHHFTDYDEYMRFRAGAMVKEG